MVWTDRFVVQNGFRRWKRWSLQFASMTAWYIIPLVGPLVPSPGNLRWVNRLIHLSDLFPWTIGLSMTMPALGQVTYKKSGPAIFPTRSWRKKDNDYLRISLKTRLWQNGIVLILCTEGIQSMNPTWLTVGFGSVSVPPGTNSKSCWKPTRLEDDPFLFEAKGLFSKAISCDFQGSLFLESSWKTSGILFLVMCIYAILAVDFFMNFGVVTWQTLQWTCCWVMVWFLVVVPLLLYYYQLGGYKTILDATQGTFWFIYIYMNMCLLTCLLICVLNLFCILNFNNLFILYLFVSLSTMCWFQFISFTLCHMRKFGIDTAQVKPNSRIPGCSTSIEVPAVKKSTTGRQFTIFQYSVF